MNTKILMTVTVVFLAVCGVSLQFLPSEIIRHFGVESGGILPIFIQLIGALYLGFAMMNWMARSLVIGGIYARPLSMGNLVHFTVGGIALVKFYISDQCSWVVWLAAVIYSLFAIVFAIVMFTHPKTAMADNSK